MAETTKAPKAAVGDILLRLNGRHYLIPAEAVGQPLEDGGSALLGMLDKELNALGAGENCAMEIGDDDGDRNARAIDARQARQCTRQARQCIREARQCTREARQCVREARQCNRDARQCTRAARQCNRQAQPVDQPAA